MEIPNDLNKLLAQLQQVTSQTNPLSGTCASGSRPTSAEIDMFLSQYDFTSETAIEQIEISSEGVFECYMFAVLYREQRVYRCWRCEREIRTLATGLDWIRTFFQQPE